MTERRCSVSEQIRRYVEARAEEIDGQEFVILTFHVHHGQLRRVRVERTDEMSSADDERLTA